MAPIENDTTIYSIKILSDLYKSASGTGLSKHKRHEAI